MKSYRSVNKVMRSLSYDELCDCGLFERHGDFCFTMKARRLADRK